MKLKQLAIMQALQLPVLEFVTLRPLGGATTTCITMGSIADGFFFFL